MRISIAALGLAGIVMAGCGPQPIAKPADPVTVALPASSVVSLVLMQNLVAGRTPEGSEVTLMVASDVRDSAGHILIPRGKLATGKVVWSRGQDTLDALSNRPPRLTISVDETQTVDGQTVALSAGPS